AMAGVLDVHAAAIAVAAQVADGTITPAQCVVPILTACSTSTLAKMVFAATAGTRLFAVRVAGAQLLMIAAAWALAGLA
ncbi:MAG TPA: hypothetical protein VN222_02270, partial [Novosphingobium sp.]|nr:hypothetical protein [Novosphingobium sp.]